MPEKPPEHASAPPRKKRTSRTRLVGSAVDRLTAADQRTAVSRRYRGIVEAISSDQGGDAYLSEVRRQLVRRLAGAAVLAEQLETQLADGHAINIADYAALTSTMVRVASRIGLDRRLREVLPTVDQYLDLSRQEAAE